MNQLKKRLRAHVQEYGELHNDDCCTNFDDSRACDGTEGDSCCKNMVLINSIVDHAVKATTEHLSYDVIYDEEKRRKIVDMYMEDYGL